MLLDEFERYCVLVADARKARIFSLYLGDLEEYYDVFVENTQCLSPLVPQFLSSFLQIS